MNRDQTIDTKLKIFVSYSRSDLEFADQLVAILEMLELEPIIDRKGIHGAENWKNRLGQLILECDMVVFVLSPDSATSDVCEWEVAEASRRGKQIVPVVCKPLGGTVPHALLRDLNYIYFYSDADLPDSGFGTGALRLRDALTVDVEWLREHTRLEELAARWQDNAQATDLMIRGSELLSYKNWRDRRSGNAPELTKLQRTFIAECEKGEEQAQNLERKRLDEMAAAQGQREAALKAAEVAQKEKEAETHRLVRRTVTGMAVALVLACLAGWQWFEARLQTKRTETALQEARAASKLAQEQTRKAIAAESLASKNAADADQAKVVAQKRSKDFAKLLRYFKLVQLATESPIAKQLTDLKIEFKVKRFGAALPAGNPVKCPGELPTISETEVFTMNTNDQSQVRHCDILVIVMENLSQKPIDVTLLFLSADLSISAFDLPVSSSPRLPAKRKIELAIQVVAYDHKTGAALPKGRERLVVLAVEATSEDSPISDFRALVPRDGPVKTEFERLLNLQTSNPMTRGAAFIAMTGGRGSVWQYYWDLVSPSN